MRITHTMASAVAIALAALAASAAAQTTTWDAATDFTPGTPPARWAYMERTGVGCTAPGGLLAAGYAPVTGIAGYKAGQNTLVYKNTTSGPLGFSSVQTNGGALAMHPGTKGECSVLRFKAPFPGIFQVAITMKSIDTASPNTVRGYVFGSGAPAIAVGGAEVLASNGATGTTKTFTRSVLVNGSNPYIDFAIDDGANPDPQGPFRFDTTEIKMTVTGREPSGGGDQGNIPVLNCSNSANNPPLVNLSTGNPGWTLKLPTGSPSAIVPTPNMVPSPWTAVPGAQWVGPQGAPSNTGTYVYETKVRVLQCPKGPPAKLTAQFRADNKGTLTLLDPGGTAIASMNQAGTPNYGFLPASLSPAGAPGVHTWVAPSNGVYTLRLSVDNSGGPTGVAANVVFSR